MSGIEEARAGGLVHVADVDGGGSWTFLTNHAHVLLCLAADPELRLRDVAARVGITERATQRILHDLVVAGYVTRTRVGRRNRYELVPARPLRHALEAGHSVGELIEALGSRASA